MTGDLHCHTTFSDGSMPAAGVVALAERLGLSYLALTDHDTTASFSLVDKLSSERLHLIPGVELSAFDCKRRRKVHILCYLPLFPEVLQAHCETVCRNRRAAAFEMIRRVGERYPITPEDVLPYAADCTSLYKQHILHALMDRGYAQSVFGDLFRTLFDPATGSCYVSCPTPDVYDVLRLVRRAGGVAVFAHPGEYDSYALLEEVCAQGLIDGIEVWHSRNKAGDAERFSALAARYDLIQTGGSDFHGMYASRPVQTGSVTTPEESYRRLLARAEQIRNERRKRKEE